MSQARWYQAEAISSVLFAWEEFHSVLLHSATGSGKNFMAAKIVENIYPSRCLIIADARDLITQSAEAVNRFAGIIPAIHQGRQKAPLTAKVVVATSQTISRKKDLEMFPEDFFEYIIADESHRFVAQKQRVFERFHKAKVCGLSATPWRSNLKDLSKWYEEVAFSMPMMNLVEEGFAPRMEVMTIPIEIDLAAVEVKKTPEGKEYDLESFSTTIEPYYEKIVEEMLKVCADKHTIIFLPLIKSSEAFAAIARRAGVSAIHIDGITEDREQVIEAFRRGRYQWICNSKVLSTGVDIPNAECFVDLSAMHSMVEYQQRVGRVMRVLPGVIDHLPGKHQTEERKAAIAASRKSCATILDFLWQHEKLGVIRPGHLIANTPEDAQAIFEKVKKQRTPEDLLRIAKQVQEEREALVVKRLEEVATRTTGKTIEPKAFGYLIGSSALMNYEPVAQWECEKPSERQLEKLGQWGIDVSQVESKGFASKLIDAMVTRFKFRLASTSQLRALSKIGVQFNPRRLTSKEAGRMISEAKLATLKSF